MKKKQTTVRLSQQDLDAIAKIKELYACESDIAAIRLALRLASRQEPPQRLTQRLQYQPEGEP